MTLVEQIFTKVTLVQQHSTKTFCIVREFIGNRSNGLVADMPASLQTDGRT
jgi:hypothetical protein